MSFRRLGISVSLAWFNGTAFPLQIHHCPLYRVEKFQDLLNPVPYSHATESRISNPASLSPSVMRSMVRVPANARMWPPGLSTRMASSQTATGGTNASQAFPMNPFPVGRYSRSPDTHLTMVSATWSGVVLDNPYGGSVTIASTLFSGMLRITSIQSP